jgi:hypothetical protein
LKPLTKELALVLLTACTYGYLYQQKNKMRIGSVFYFILSIYAVMVNWYFNHNILYAILAFLLSPFYLIYELLVGHFAHGMWLTILHHYI